MFTQLCLLPTLSCRPIVIFRRPDNCTFTSSFLLNKEYFSRQKNPISRSNNYQLSGVTVNEMTGNHKKRIKWKISRSKWGFLQWISWSEWDRSQEGGRFRSIKGKTYDAHIEIVEKEVGFVLVFEVFWVGASLDEHFLVGFVEDLRWSTESWMDILNFYHDWY